VCPRKRWATSARSLPLPQFHRSCEPDSSRTTKLRERMALWASDQSASPVDLSILTTAWIPGLMALAPESPTHDHHIMRLIRIPSDLTTMVETWDETHPKILHLYDEQRNIPQLKWQSVRCKNHNSHMLCIFLQRKSQNGKVITGHQNTSSC